MSRHSEHRAHTHKKGEMLHGKNENDCSFIALDWRREIIFLLRRFSLHTKGSAVEVNSVIMETCFECRESERQEEVECEAVAAAESVERLQAKSNVERKLFKFTYASGG